MLTKGEAMSLYGARALSLALAICALLLGASVAGAADMLVYYDYLEDGHLAGGVITISPDDPFDRAIFGLDEPPMPASWAFTTIINNGPTSNRIDIVMLGDGYTAAELGDYATHVTTIMTDFFAEEPLDAYATYFNVHRVDVISNESGVDEPDNGIYKDTALDMTYDCGGIARLLCINVSKAESAAAVAPDKQTIIALANSTRYGGAGYSNLSTAAGNNSASSEITLHEYGHSFAKLADEYTYGGSGTYTGGEPGQPNVSIYTAAEQAAMETKWYRWLDLPNVDTFEGAMYHEYGIYRPTDNSKMRSLNRPFEEVNVEQFVIQIYKSVSPIDDATPSSVEPLPMFTVLYVKPLKPTDHALDVQWVLNGDAVPGATGELFMPDYGSLSPGIHTVAVTVVDNTSCVRDEGARAAWLTETRTWDVLVADPIYVDDDNAGDPAQNGSPQHPFESIQAGIDDAAAGEVVKVLAGTYDEWLVMTSNVAVVGAGPGSTVIAPTESGPTVMFYGVDNAMLAGVTIAPPPDSVAVRSIDSTMTLRDSVCSGGYNGVGINFTGSVRIINCLLTGNANDAVWAGGEAAVDIVNCTVADNGGRGAYLGTIGPVAVANSILWQNADDLSISPAASVSVSYSNIGDGDFAGSNGNISADPLFVRGPLHDYYLSQTAAGQPADSPCVDAGSAAAVAFLGLDGLTTRTDGAPDDTSVDMGYHAAYALWIDSIARGSDDVTIHWNARSGISYVVEWSADRATWNEVPVGETSLWTDIGALTDPMRFYRVRENEAPPPSASASPSAESWPGEPSSTVPMQHTPAAHPAGRQGNVGAAAGGLGPGNVRNSAGNVQPE